VVSFHATDIVASQWVVLCLSLSSLLGF